MKLKERGHRSGGPAFKISHIRRVYPLVWAIFGNKHFTMTAMEIIPTCEMAMGKTVRSKPGMGSILLPHTGIHLQVEYHCLYKELYSYIHSSPLIHVLDGYQSTKSVNLIWDCIGFLKHINECHNRKDKIINSLKIYNEAPPMVNSSENKFDLAFFISQRVHLVWMDQNHSNSWMISLARWISSARGRLFPGQTRVGGEKCDRRMSNNYGIGPFDCTPCGCVREGSLDNDPRCDPQTGDCLCKQHVEGKRCDMQDQEEHTLGVAWRNGIDTWALLARVPHRHSTLTSPDMWDEGSFFLIVLRADELIQITEEVVQKTMTRMRDNHQNLKSRTSFKIWVKMYTPTDTE